MIKNYLKYTLLAGMLFATVSCGQKGKSTEEKSTADSGVVAEPKADSAAASTPATTDNSNRKAASVAEILARKEVPILCYHQIRDWKASDSKVAKDYIIPVNTFKAHIKLLADSGYHTVLPDQVYNYLVYGDPLPSKPVMLTFDDTEANQFLIANEELKKYGYKGVYFIMTVSIGRPKYMTKDQIKKLADEGNTIGSHTWDHHNVKKYQGEDWVTQIEKPTKTLEGITGKKIDYFAYPFGLWNKEAFPELKKRGFKAAFSLADKKDQEDPLFTIRRIIASGYWSANTMHNAMKNSFH
ncbi:polysaccharide deacetylase family protein [Solitalea sp. MAHUQ-68]|uniref:Polysaccharide deacetylase family protein n=1 Tax=Solitalea agri TaxID=2953739 RepID=A0A9X2F4B7_9SPHI|nr:polysaccharide deacetylase family protein [Solitalea agri]MCO4294554.1 polysaccharide deacetylase family protein [Solitalea agri]